MKQTLSFLKLRILQLQYDKTALFFCYVLPVLLLLGIGYPLQKQNEGSVELHYRDLAQNTGSAAFLRYMEGEALVRLAPVAETGENPVERVSDNDIRHFLLIESSPEAEEGVFFRLFENDKADNRVENAAVKAVLEDYSGAGLKVQRVESAGHASYIATLLPGLIGMTFLIIGLNGFGGVLIEEKNRGLYKNLKTINASPVPFLAGLFISRMLVAYSVAIAMCLIGIFVFDVSFNVDPVSLFLVVTLGCVAFLGLGLVIAVFSPSVNAFNGIVNFVQLPFIVFSGVFFSVSAFPEWMQFVSGLIPLTHMNNALQKLFFEPASLRGVLDFRLEILVLFVWCAATLLIGWKKFKW